MVRIARIIAPDYPHHITQRGNRRQTTFFCEEDYLVYLDLMAHWCRHYKVDIWSWCLMPNHVHLIAVPQTTEGLARAIGEAHRRYTRHVNFRENWRGLSRVNYLVRFCESLKGWFPRATRPEQPTLPKRAIDIRNLKGYDAVYDQIIQT